MVSDYLLRSKVRDQAHRKDKLENQDEDNRWLSATELNVEDQRQTAEHTSDRRPESHPQCILNIKLCVQYVDQARRDLAEEYHVECAWACHLGRNAHSQQNRVKYGTSAETERASKQPSEETQAYQDDSVSLVEYNVGLHDVNATVLELKILLFAYHNYCNCDHHSAKSDKTTLNQPKPARALCDTKRRWSIFAGQCEVSQDQAYNQSDVYSLFLDLEVAFFTFDDLNQLLEFHVRLLILTQNEHVLSSLHSSQCLFVSLLSYFHYDYIRLLNLTLSLSDLCCRYELI